MEYLWAVEKGQLSHCAPGKYAGILRNGRDKRRPRRMNADKRRYSKLSGERNLFLPTKNSHNECSSSASVSSHITRDAV